MPQATLNSTTV